MTTVWEEVVNYVSYVQRHYSSKQAKLVKDVSSYNLSRAFD